MDLSITEEELDGVLDRERVFASATNGWGDSSLKGGARWGRRGHEGDGDGWGPRQGGDTGPVTPLPREGDMYDVVDELDASVLTSMD